ncbi:MAG: hypothetical protein ACE5WD_07655 [Candidatus Aminicenantia bacterium]
MRKKLILTLGLVSLFFLFPVLIHADELMLGPADFLPYMDDNDYYQSGEYLYSVSGATNRYFYAPVHLPQNAKVTSVTLYYWDDDAGYVQLYFFKENMYNANLYTLCSYSTTGATNAWRYTKISPISYNTINNGGYTYFIRIYLSSSTAGSGLRLHGVKILYNP